MSDVVTTTSAETFENDILKAEVALVDFWAEWCGPCKAMGPVFEAVANEYHDRVKFVKLDVDQSPTLSAKYGVRGIPTLILFKQGQVLATKTGMLTQNELVHFLEENV